VIACAVIASGTGVLLAVVGLASCASDEASSARFGGQDAGGDVGITAPSPFADGGAPIEANAIVLVHAASFPAFRICFSGAPEDLPQPSTELMPESNVVGVDVGTAVRLPARSDMLGDAFAFPESLLRGFYPTFGGSGPTCSQLLTASGTKDIAVPVGKVTEDLSRGVHAIILGGCRATSIDPMASADRCGADWDATKGNLKLTTLSLMAYSRAGQTRLAVQLVQLSPALQRRAEGRVFGLAFGSLDASAPPPFVEGAVPFGKAVPNPPAILDYSATDLQSYGTSGVFVTLGGAVDEAGAPIPGEAGVDASAAREVVLSQSLAEIQKRSSPRSLPPDWFSFASSYVVLSVGDTDPRLCDGGRDDDPRRALHLLAIPLATPDAGVGATLDASP
jgi:hypothetical protein